MEKIAKNKSTKGVIGLITVVMALACVQGTYARSLGHLITKETQAREGLEFTLSAVRESADAIVVRVVIPRKGNLQTLSMVRMSIGDGQKILLLSPLETREEGNALVTGFQISPILAEQSYIELITETGRTETYYMVRLKEYITEKK